MRSSVRVAMVGIVDLALLVGLRSEPFALARVARPRTWLAEAGADTVAAHLAAFAIWCVAVRVAIGLLAMAAARLPGAAGFLAGRVAVRTLPAALRRVIAGSAGLGVLLAPVAADAHSIDDPAPARSTALHAWVGSVPGPAWPSSPSPRSEAADDKPIPGPHWPGTRKRGSPRTPAPRSHDTHAASHDVTVRAGDSLWLLAAHRLGPHPDDDRVAAYWPRVYAANRAAVGHDPALITPGQVLHVPGPPREESP